MRFAVSVIRENAVLKRASGVTALRRSGRSVVIVVYDIDVEVTSVVARAVPRGPTRREAESVRDGIRRRTSMDFRRSR